MKREFSAGGVVYKKLKGKIFWLITKSKPSKDYPEDVWRLPKGWLDDKDEGDKPGPLASGERKATHNQIVTTAEKEVMEEGGVRAKVIEKVVTDKYFYTDKEGEKVIKFVTYFLMEWQKDLKRGFGEETEKIDWLIFKDAKKRLTYSREKKVLDKAKEKVSSVFL